MTQIHLRILVPLFLALFISSPSWGVTITVTSTNDSGPGSLRDAIETANAGDAIKFSLSYPATITLSSTLTIGTSLTISGPGASKLAIDGNNTVRVLRIEPGVAVTISGLTIQNGNCRAEFNCLGGGVLSYGTVTLDNITVSGSSAFDGGGVMSYNGALTLTNSTVWGNWSDSIGGGVFNACPSSVAVQNSTVWGNSSGEHGGGLATYNCSLTIINSTVAGNNSARDGGGIFNLVGTVAITNSTIANNSAPLGGNGGGIFNSATLTLKNTLLSTSFGGNCKSYGAGATTDGYNLSDDATCSDFLSSLTDLNNIPAGLDPNGLQANGGPTKTIALLPTSPAVDIIPVANCIDVSGNPVTADQRGITRPQGSRCDIGAFELVRIVPFSAFTGKLDIHAGSNATIPPRLPSYDLNSQFSLGNNSNGINPVIEAVNLQLGTYQVTIPANSFKQLKNGAKAGSYVFSGVIGGVSLSVQIVTLGGNSYQFKAEGSPVNLTALSNPVTLKLTIGDDSGTAPVYADF